MMKHFINNHSDLIEVVLTSGSGITLMFTEIELGLKIAIGIVVLGFSIYKWRCAYIDRNK